MAHSTRDRTLALAGIFQAAKLVQEVALHGTCDDAQLETCLNSIFNTEPSSPEAVYGSALCLTNGLQLLAKQLDTKTQERNLELTKYVLNVLYLERKLAKKPALLNQISEGVARAQDQTMHFPPAHPNILASLADTYSNSISTLTPRIIVQGEQSYLSNPDVANKIRTLLLAAIRSAVLWSQCGGSRLRLLFNRAKIVSEAKAIIQTVNP